jgi:hypothetical protein
MKCFAGRVLLVPYNFAPVGWPPPKEVFIRSALSGREKESSEGAKGVVK